MTEEGYNLLNGQVQKKQQKKIFFCDLKKKDA